MPAPVSYEDIRRAARDRLPSVLFDYVDGGAMSESTLARNCSDLAKVELRQRILRDVGQLDTTTKLFGETLPMPLVLAPLGIAGLLRRRGEAAAARAAEARNVPFCLSNFSICAYDEVRAAVKTPPWFQICLARERALSEILLDRVEALGARVLILTVDVPTPAVRYRDLRSGLDSPRGPIAGASRALDGLLHPAWLVDVFCAGRPHAFGNVQQTVDAHAARTGKAAVYAPTPSATWEDLRWLRGRWRGPLLVKGVLDGADADAACGIGVDGVIVSNHGGRQLEGARSTISALPEVVRAVAGRADVLVDGGIRTGADMLKALAFGARACLIGRPWAYALAARGEAGVKDLLALLESELRASMAMTGVTELAQVSEEIVVRTA